ncbi:hypothetical protein [Pseudogemmobacter sp. W21_MBD1_M6]|jgi:hypothetical protein|uniref:hypothetical protein n=1 Tax=Pseudogemmobacter sp. W21_MBD1_M6 TaxID=3240271 RepID=UPI003F9A64EF
MRTNQPSGELAIQFIAVSACYVVAYMVTISLTPFVEVRFGPEATSAASLLFLPHGVRVLSAWLLGWRSIPLLIPATYLTHYNYYGSAAFTVPNIVAASFGVTCAVFSFWFLSRIGWDFRPNDIKKANWTDVAFAGCFASVLNSIGQNYVYDTPLMMTAAFFVGDIAGMFGTMLALMMAFRWYRLFKGIQ